MEFYNTLEQTLINGALPFKYTGEEATEEAKKCNPIS
jgi:hypothetical protein